MSGEQTRAPLAIIGGTGFDSLDGFECERTEQVQTPFGTIDAPLRIGTLSGRPAMLLQRHGAARNVPPHRINYRANVWALQQAGAQTVVAIGAVGGIGENASPGALVLPDQLIDYTWGRDHTFFADDLDEVRHVEFANPYDETLRRGLLQAGRTCDIEIVESGCYGATQGPRLETAAEIQRMRRDGCTLVGMTGMPEAALAREIGLPYACVAVVVNWAAGIGDETITMALIRANMKTGMIRANKMLARAATEFIA